jgi:hypothetical protein
MYGLRQVYKSQFFLYVRSLFRNGARRHLECNVRKVYK